MPPLLTLTLAAVCLATALPAAAPAADEFRAILVGKDGGAKLASPDPLSAERLFAEIDAMPMRRDEARRQGAGR